VSGPTPAGGVGCSGDARGRVGFHQHHGFSTMHNGADSWAYKRLLHSHADGIPVWLSLVTFLTGPGTYFIKQIITIHFICIALLVL